MKRISTYTLLLYLMLCATSCGTEFSKIGEVPYPEDLNPKIIPTEGYEGWFYLVEYVYDESMSTRTSLGEEKQCYRYRLIIEDNVEPESDDCDEIEVWVKIPRNQTGKERKLSIEVKLAKTYHNDEFGTYCNSPDNEFTEWMVAWNGIQEYVEVQEDNEEEEEEDDEVIIVPFPPQK